MPDFVVAPALIGPTNGAGAITSDRVIDPVVPEHEAMTHMLPTFCQERTNALSFERRNCWELFSRCTPESLLRTSESRIFPAPPSKIIQLDRFPFGLSLLVSSFANAPKDGMMELFSSCPGPGPSKTASSLLLDLVP